MRQRDIVLVCVLLAAIVLGMFTYTYLERKNVPVEEVSVVDPAPNAVPSYISRIEAKHFFEDGTHTIVGEVMMPTPCDLLTYEATIAEAFHMEFGLASASASAEATQRATFNGQPIELNMIEAAAGETPESFELFIKG